MDKIEEGYYKDKLALFIHVEVVMPILDKAKYKLKWNFPLHRQVKNLVLKRRLRLMKKIHDKVRENKRKCKRKRKKTKLDL